jgi:hypothetical protein
MKKPDQVQDQVGLDCRYERPTVGCVDGGEKLDLPTRAAWMSLIWVMRAKISLWTRVNARTSFLASQHQKLGETRIKKLGSI